MLLQSEVSDATRTNVKGIPDVCQLKIKALADASQIFKRILTVLNAKNAPEVARKLGLAKQSVYDWQKNIPSLENLIRIAESGNSSLHWLITGEGERFLNPQNQITFDELLEQKIREIINNSGNLQTDFENKLRELIRSELQEERLRVGQKIAPRSKQGGIRFDRGDEINKKAG